ncbi:MAG: hypothetical protein ACOXZV_02820 [Bacteroidales bacterium]|jgi:hypothetical protein
MIIAGLFDSMTKNNREYSGFDLASPRNSSHPVLIVYLKVLPGNRDNYSYPDIKSMDTFPDYVDLVIRIAGKVIYQHISNHSC